jgi:hypothetical protein
MLIFAIKPEWSTQIANYFGIGRGVDFLFYIAHITLFFVVLLYYFKFKILETKFAKLTREISIEKTRSQRKNMLNYKDKS